jgi:hypothetical protein
VFGDDELPVLFAHGQHNDPDNIILATGEYRRAYSGKLGAVLKGILETRRVVWIGFSFADARIAAILREIADYAGSAISPGAAPRHVTIMPWDPRSATDPQTLRQVVELQYGALPLLYPVLGSDHSALQRLLESLPDPKFTVEPEAQAPAATEVMISAAGPPVTWAHDPEHVRHFVGRTDELNRLDRWCADPEVRLIGVTAWGGVGKTTLVTEWIGRWSGAHPPGRAVEGVFGWSFYQDSSVDRWCERLLDWAAEAVGFEPPNTSLTVQVITLLQQHEIALVLDGLEIRQDGPATEHFGRLLDGPLRRILTTVATNGTALLVLTSRFPFADVEQFDGTTARMLDVPALTPTDGANLLATTGGDWLSEDGRLKLSALVDGHALALSVMGAALAARPDEKDVTSLTDDLMTAGRTNTRVARVLRFYAERLSKPECMLVALVSLFQRPVNVETILLVGQNAQIDALPSDMDAAGVESAVRQHLDGLLTWHHDAMISAHPLVRDTFRPLVLTSNTAHVVRDVSLVDLDGVVTDRDQGREVVDVIELLIDSGELGAADDVYTARTAAGEAWMQLPAASLGLQCARAFVGSPERRSQCEKHLGSHRTSFYLNDVGLFAMSTGETVVAEEALLLAVQIDELEGHSDSFVTYDNLTELSLQQGNLVSARNHADHTLAARLKTTISGVSVTRPYALMAAVLALEGHTMAAEAKFIEADRMELGDNGRGTHLFSQNGIEWCEHLIRTGRVSRAYELAIYGSQFSEGRMWGGDSARFDQMLALCAMDRGDIQKAGELLQAAIPVFDEGNLLWEWGSAVCDLSTQRRLAARLDEAEQLSSDVIRMAGPHGFVPQHADALVARAHTRLALAAAGDADRVSHAEDDAHLALRLASKTRRLPWQELGALEVLTMIDEQTSKDRGWSAKARKLRAALVPAGLSEDPLAEAAKA